MAEKKYLWLNLTDVHGMGTIAPMGSPISFILPTDQMIGTVMSRGGRLDDVFIVYEVEADRLEGIEAALQVIAKRKIGRKLRTRQTVNPPGDHWQYV
jgi:hypothetical protein